MGTHQESSKKLSINKRKLKMRRMKTICSLQSRMIPKRGVTDEDVDEFGGFSETQSLYNGFDEEVDEEEERIS
ncbi:hypothetical protein ACHQM5_020527 [Ranunculus cassubicifolius]